MPYLATLLSGLLMGFGKWIAERIGKILLSIGIGGVVFTGVNALINGIFNNIFREIGGLSGAIYEIFLMAGFGTAFNILISALAMSLTISAGKQASS